MKRWLVLLLILCSLLAACAPANDFSNSDGDSNVTAGDTNSGGETNVTPDNPNSGGETNDLGNAEDAQLASFNALFGDMRSWYNRALTSLYASPAQVDLKMLFYHGFPEESQTPTDQEWESLKDKPGFDLNFDLIRLPADKMNGVLTHYFGITLEDVNPSGFEGLTYLESTDCYYRMVTDVRVVENFNATAVETLTDGTIRLSYTAEFGEAFVAVLKPVGDGYQILSNQRA